MTQRAPEIVDLADSELDDLLHRVEQQQLSPEDYGLLLRLVKSYVFVTSLLQRNKITLAKLKKLLFGSRTEKTKAVTGGSTDTPHADGQTDASPTQAPAASCDEGASLAAENDEQNNASASETSQATGELQTGDTDASPKPGHGRNGADAYTGAERVPVPHATLQAGDACPSCGQGTIYDSAPGVIVRIVGQAPLQATVYEVQKLRCNLCGKLLTAEAPADAQGEKYDATAAVMIILLKYGTGMPFNRLEGLQGNMGIPLPASTQWDVVFAASPIAAVLYEELIRRAAQGQVVYNDDTWVRILKLMGEHAPKFDDDDAKSSRTGVFTTGIVATCEGYRIALFFSGQKHAGENLADVLQHRAKELGKPIQMCDPLSRNTSGDFETIVANCLAHARRQFVDINEAFPGECRYVLEALRSIYHNDALAQQEGLSDQGRLEFHQAHSGPTMEALHNWLHRQFDEKLVEPNSALGKAIRYLLNHWEKLTLFLRVPGAPLDNNICERALKKAILHRKNAYFYKTTNGSRVGDIYMSLIYTCELCNVNAFEYLKALLEHPEETSAHPEQWLPWNYRSALAELEAKPLAAETVCA